VAWYTDTKKQTHTQTYVDRTKATEERRTAAEYGWRVDAEEESEGPLRDPNWAIGGNFGAFMAGTRPQRLIVVTYVRTGD
jgi:hypothetical protein